MNPVIGWALAVLMVGASYQSYGWQGVAFAASAIVFWLLLQFNRAVRVMKNASHRPVGHVPSAVMFHAKLKDGMTMLQVVAQTKSLGRRVDAAGTPAPLTSPAADEDWAWADVGGSEVRLHFVRGRLARWTLDRSADTADTADTAEAPASAAAAEHPAP